MVGEPTMASKQTMVGKPTMVGEPTMAAEHVLQPSAMPHSLADAEHPSIERTIIIRDRRKPNQYTTDNVIAREWLPILRVGDAFYFYSVYLSMANRQTESSWGSLRTQAEYLQCGVDLIIRGNRLLEICELLYIKAGDYQTSNEYYILEPPPLTPELKARIHQRLAEIDADESSKNWRSWVTQVRKALDKHRSLPSIWSERRARRGGRPVRTVRPQNGVCESQAPLSVPDDGACEPQPREVWNTTTAVVEHNQGAREPQLEQEQTTEELKVVDGVSAVHSLCACLGIAPTIVDLLLEEYPIPALLRQLRWLPARNPREPAAMLLSALKKDWACPAQYDPGQADKVWAGWLRAAGYRQPLLEEWLALGALGGGSEGLYHTPQKRGMEAQGTAPAVPADTGDLSSQPPEPVCEGSGSEGANRNDPHGAGVVNPDTAKLWTQVLGELRMQMTGATFDRWLRGSEVIAATADALTVRVRDEYAAEWLTTRWGGPIQRTVAGIAGHALSLRFVTGSEK